MRFALVRSLAFFAFVVFVRSASAGIINLSDGSFDPVPPPGNIGSGGPVSQNVAPSPKWSNGGCGWPGAWSHLASSPSAFH